MCGIAGLLHCQPDETPNQLKDMLVALQHRGPDGAGMAVGSEVRTGPSLDGLSTEDLEGRQGLGHVRLAIVGGKHGPQPMQSDDGKLLLLHNGEIYNHHELRKELAGKVRFETKTDSEVILRLLEREYKGDLQAALRRVLKELDGVYALAVSDGEDIVIARDPLGVRQLYLGHKGKTLAFASERKGLQAVELDDASTRLEPGHLAWVEEGRWIQKEFAQIDLQSVPTDLTDQEAALRAYQQVLEQALHKRTRDRDRVGVIFSGGIDSVLIAHLLRQSDVPFTCYCAGFRGSADLGSARAVAEEFGFPIRCREFTLDDIQALLPQIMETIEDRSQLQVEVAIPIYAAVEAAAEAGERVLLTGQAADELFGGYSWYARIVDQEGYDSFIRHAITDIEYLYKETLEREDKITMAHSIELRVPYLDLAVVHTALRIDPRLKIHRGGDRLGKRIHRQLAERLGIPREIAWRVKEAAQHGAGIHDALRALAHRSGFTRECVDAADYCAQDSVTEVLGSCSRYGYRYGEAELWKDDEHVQCYLDTLAWKHGLLSENETQQLVPALEDVAAD